MSIEIVECVDCAALCGVAILPSMSLHCNTVSLKLTSNSYGDSIYN